MSAAALFTPTGDYYIPVTVRLADIDRTDQRAAERVYNALFDNLRGKTVLGERYTDRVLRQSPWLQGFSYRFIQKGLKALEKAGIIKRERKHGRREITILGRLRSKQSETPTPRAGAREAKPSVIPNVGPVADATPDQVAAAAQASAELDARAAAEAASETETEAFMAGARARRAKEQAAKDARARMDAKKRGDPAGTLGPGGDLMASLARILGNAGVDPGDAGKPPDP